jgi:crossover junction endodeoxyribonuclease RuvC
MAMFLGIDPGRQGAIAVLDGETMEITCHDMPDTTANLHNLIAGLPLIKLAILEKPFFPSMIGITNAVRIAEAYGTLKGALAWRDIPAREVTPANWKKRLGLSSNKAASRDKASMLCPDSAGVWARVKDDGRAEAALLAWLAKDKFK